MSADYWQYMGVPGTPDVFRARVYDGTSDAPDVPFEGRDVYLCNCDHTPVQIAGFPGQMYEPGCRKDCAAVPLRIARYRAQCIVWSNSRSLISK